MLEIRNTKVYDLKESIIACRNAMRLELSDYSEEDFQKSFERAKKLVQASKNGVVKCHDNFLTGIRVSFDLKYPQYISPEIQRYHFFDIVTSMSKMHRLIKMDFEKCCNKYVTRESIEQMKQLIAEYNTISNELVLDGYHDDHTERLYEAWMKIVSNCPPGLEMWERCSTNYKQLQTMYFQRKGHKLKEDWGNFLSWIESLPYSHELIIGDIKDSLSYMNG